MRLYIREPRKAIDNRGYCLICWDRIYKGQEWCKIKDRREAHLSCAEKIVGLTEDPLKMAEMFRALKAGFLENTEKLYRLKKGLGSEAAYSVAEAEFQEIIEGGLELWQD